MKEVDDFSFFVLIIGYVNLGRINDVRRIFVNIINLCIVVWNILIFGCVINYEGIEVLVLFNMLRNNGFKLDCFIFVSILNVCFSIGIFEYGKQFYVYVCKVGVLKDIVVVCFFIDMYFKCRSLDDVCKFFIEFEFYDIILLNFMINVYNNCGRVQEVKQIFDNMRYKILILWNLILAGLG